MKKQVIFIAALFLVFRGLFAQPEGYGFHDIKEQPITPVKDQERTGTCWSYATTSFIESEILRMGGPKVDLSEMYFVRQAYEDKAERYVRFHGKSNFSPGGQAHDVMTVLEDEGMATEESYPGLDYGSEEHRHTEMNNMIKAMLDAVLKSRQMTPVWMESVERVLDTYLGCEDISIEYEGKQYTPGAFRDLFDPRADDYLEFTSYTHHAFYEPVILEVPDNWSHDFYYNIPLDELVRLVDHAVDHGYSVCWDGDVSEPGFQHKKLLAILPGKDLTDMETERQEAAFKEPIKEMEVSQEHRQKMFDSFESTDDHLMHLVGKAKDKKGRRFYIIKNSWGPGSNDHEGKLFMSVPYLRLHTVAVMVHRDAVPDSLNEKLGLR